MEKISNVVGAQFDPFRQIIRDVRGSWPHYQLGYHNESVARYAFYFAVIKALVEAKDHLIKEAGFESNFNQMLDAIKNNTLDNFFNNVVHAPVDENFYNQGLPTKQS